MGVQIQTKTIGGMKFSLAQMSGWENFEAFQRFMSIAGPLLPAIGTAFRLAMGKKTAPAKADGSDGEEAATKDLSAEEKSEMLEAITRGLPDALRGCTPKQMRELAEMMLASCTVGIGGKKVRLLDVFDSEMTGKLNVVLGLLGWAVLVHFGSFLPSLGNIGASEAVKETSPSTSPST